MRLFILFLLTFFSFSLNAQVSTTLSFTENDGLIGNYIRDLLIDNNGLLWIATENGLSIYDGNQFKNYDQTHGLPSKKTGALAIDKDGSIYVGCSKGGLVKIKNDSISPCVTDKSDKKHNYRKLLYSDFYNTLFVGTENGIFVLHNNKLIPVLYNRDTTERSIILSICARENLIFFNVLKGKSEGIYKLFYNQKSPEKTIAKRIYLKGRFYCNLIDNYLIAGEHNKLLKFDLSDLDKEPQEIEIEKDFFVWNILPYKNHKLLIGGLGDGRFKGGLFEYNIQNDQVEKVSINQNSQSINTLLYHPKFDLIWIGKENELVAFQNTPIEHFTPNIAENIIDICYAHKQLYILTDRGVYLYDKGTFEKIIEKEKISKIIQREYHKHLRKDGIYFKNQFDISLGSELVKLVFTRNQVFVQTGKGSLSIPDLKTYLPFGFGVFNLKSDQGAYNYVNYTDLYYYQSLKQPYVYEIISKKKKIFNGIIKMGTVDDTYLFLSSQYGIFSIYKNQEYTIQNNNPKFENEEWIDMDPFGNGKIWGISDQRLILVSYKSELTIEKQFELEEIGIKGSSIKWIKQRKDQLLIAANDGLYIYKSSSLLNGNIQFVYYNQWNGYPFISADHPQIDENGDIITHTNHDIVWIRNNSFLNKSFHIEIYDVLINNFKKDKSFLKNKKLSYQTNHIAFHFRVVKFPSAKNLIYRYRINNEAWIMGNQVDFQSLRTGLYHITLEVVDKNTNQRYFEKFQFQIVPPFWQTFWFWIIVIIILSVLIFLLFKWRIRSVQKRSEEKTMLSIQNSELQLRSLQIQMNPHFIFNALNSIQYLVLSKNIKETLTYLGKLAVIIRTNLEFASENSILIIEEIEFLNNYIQIELLRFKNKFQFECKCESIPENLCMPPMLVQPIIENAIKHGIQNCDYTGLIQIHFKIHESILTITITDNGIGRKAAQLMDSSTKKKHLGLSVIEKRVNLLNDLHKTNQYTLQIIDLQNNENKTGTQVTLTIPVKY